VQKHSSSRPVYVLAIFTSVLTPTL